MFTLYAAVRKRSAMEDFYNARLVVAVMRPYSKRRMLPRQIMAPQNVHELWPGTAPLLVDEDGITTLDTKAGPAAAPSPEDIMRGFRSAGFMVIDARASGAAVWQ